MIFENERNTDNTQNANAARYFARFSSTNEANEWLSMQNDIVLMDATVGTVSRFGMPANKIDTE